MRERLDLTERRSAGGIVRAALGVYGSHPLLFATLAASVVAPYDLIVLAVTGYGPLRQAQIPGAGTWLLLEILNVALINALISALHIHAVRQVGDRNRPVLTDVARRGLSVLPAVAATSIMASLGIGLGLLLLVIPGVILALRWAVASQAAAIENRDWQAALRRSRELTRGNYLHVLAVLLIATLIVQLVARPAEQITAGRGASAGPVALGILVATLSQSFTALITALLYFDLTARSRPGAAALERDRPRDLDP